MEIKSLSKLGRFKDIVLTLIKHGFADMVERMDLPGGDHSRTDAGEGDSAAGQISSGGGTYERLRRTLEDLGPTFVKLGQLMSMRPDLIPPDLVVELQKLQDTVTEVDYAEAREVIEASLGRKVEEVFPVFDPDPIAAASLSQVYRAALSKSGPAVAVKVQRPGIRKVIEQDLDILVAIAKRLDQRYEEMRLYDLPELARVTRRTLMRELDFQRESRYQVIAKRNMKDQPGIYIPDVYQRYCTGQMLVMEHVRGEKIKNLDFAAMEDRHELARLGLRAGISQIFRDGFFHADPHSGNMLLMPDRRFCLLDWGMVGRLTSRDRYDLVDLVRAIADGDGQGMLDAVLKIAVHKSEEIDRRGLERELLEISDIYGAVPVRQMNLGRLLLDITHSMREFQLGVPSDFATMIKSLITLEGAARNIDPDLNVIEEAEPYVERIARERYRPDRMLGNMAANLSGLFTSRGGLSRRLGKILSKLELGEMRVRFEHENLQDLQETLENTSNKLTFGIIIAALIIGSSMIITTGVRPYLFGYPAFGIAGYIVSAVLGLWVVVNMIRTKRF